MLPTSTTTTRRPVSRKNDPVNKFHQFRAEWSRSSFLKRLEDPASSRAKHRMYGGVGYHAAMGGNVFERK